MSADAKPRGSGHGADSTATAATVSVDRPTLGAVRPRSLRGEDPTVTSERATTPAPEDGGDASLIGDRFRLLAMLGEGGMGRVYRAYDSLLAREVAIKIIHGERLGDLVGRARLFREAQAMAAIHHPGLVDLHDVDPERGILVMELVDGEPLRAHMARRGRLDASELRRLADELLDVLAALHQQGVVHRDVKPSNLMIEHGGRLRLVDFGIAHVADSEMTVTGEVLGTPSYMAPEQLRGEAVGPAADVYASAVTLFEAATGARPSLALDPARATQVLHEATGDRALAEAIGRSLELDPIARFADAAAFRAALSVAPAVARPRRRGWLVAGVALVAALGAAGGLGLARDRVALRPAPARPAPRPSDIAPTATTPGFTDPVLRRSFAALLDAIESGDVDASYDLVDQLLAAAPDDPAVLYHAVLINLWREQAEDTVRQLCERALRTPRTRRERALIEGVLAATERDFARAADRFGAGLLDAPRDRDLRYGMFEALWHQGHLAEAVPRYLELVRDSPAFRLGDSHLLSYYLDRRDLEGLRWLSAGKSRVSRARLDSVIAMATVGATGVAGDESAMAGLKHYERALVLLMAGRAEARDARLALEELEYDGARTVVARLSLALAAGDDAASARLALEVEDSPGLFLWEARMALEEAASLAASPRVPRRLVDFARVELDRLHPGHHPISTDLALALLAARQQDRALLAALAARSAPELAALAGGLLAELDGDLVAARAGLDRALATAGDGRFRLAEHYHRARLARLAGDLATTSEACGRVVAPYLLDVAWGALARDCRDWLPPTRAP